MAIDMDATQIRNEAKTYANANERGEPVAPSSHDRLKWADEIAAWAMSGALPAQEPEPPLEPISQSLTDCLASGGDP